ncbi:protein of unknown function [Serratia sp. Tan611]|nr:protein of unknown function [Serratia sp. Tan611]
MLIIQEPPHLHNMPIPSRLAFQPTVPAPLILSHHPPTGHFISTASHNFTTYTSLPNAGHYIPFAPPAAPRLAGSDAMKQ